MTRAEAIQKALKIKALADRGATDGEKAVAQGKLQEFMQKHNLTMADLGFRTHSQNEKIKKQSSGARSQHNQPFGTYSYSGNDPFLNWLYNDGGLEQSAKLFTEIFAKHFYRR